MTELPQGWAWSTVGELGEYINGRGFKKTEWSTRGRPIIRIQNLTGSGSSFNYFDGPLEERYIVPPGSLLVSWAATLGVYRWGGPEGVLNQHIFRVHSFIDEGFHRYLLQHALDLMQRNTHGSGMVHITRGRFDGTPVLLPPLAEQERIVAAIEEAFSKIDAGEAGLRTARQLLKRMRDSVLAAAVSGRLVPQDPTDTPASALLANLGVEPLGVSLPLPGGWACASLGLLATVVSGNTPKGLDEVVTESGDVPLIKVGDLALDDRYLTRSRTWISSEDKERLRLRTCPAGTIVFPKRGGAIATNRKRILGREATFDLNTMGLVPRGGLGDWVWTWFAQLDLRTISDGSNVPQLNHSDVAPLAVPVPPSEEQLRIVTEVERQFSFIEACERAVDAGLARSAALRRSILKSAFEGSLVPQDLSDEPASLLLDRIRVERVQHDESGNPKRRRQGTVKAI